MTVAYIFLSFLSMLFTATTTGYQQVQSAYSELLKVQLVQDVSLFVESYYLDNATYPEFNEIEIDTKDYIVKDGIIILRDSNQQIQSEYCYYKDYTSYAFGVDEDSNGSIDFKVGEAKDECKVTNL
jgi:hypothetical protein